MSAPQHRQQQQTPGAFRGEGRILGGGPTTNMTTTTTGATGGGGSGSRSNTPVIARYTVLPQQPQDVGAAGVIHATTLLGRPGLGAGPGTGVTAAAAALAGAAGVADEQRSSTPARLSRVLTPLKGRRGITTFSDLAHREEQQRQQQEAEAAAAAARRIERRSRRKLRRWANDRLVGVAQLAGVEVMNDGMVGGADGGEGGGSEFAHFHALEHHSNFTKLMSEENTELRERFLQGYGAPSDARRRGAGGGGGGGRHAPRTALQEAERRFLQLERRVRGVLTQIMASGDPGMDAFLAAVEDVLRAFLQGEPVPTDDDLPDALAHALVGPLALKSGAVLCLPLRNSAFLRLLVHGSCQYYGLKSRSEDLGAEVRAVLITKPAAVSRSSSASATAATATKPLGMPMRGFIRARLEQSTRTRGGAGRRLVEPAARPVVVA